MERLFLRRQRFLLSLISLFDIACTATDLQKIVFLYQSGTGDRFYDFVPYRFGCFSFTLSGDLSELRRRKLAIFELVKPTGGYPYALPFVETKAITDLRGDDLVRESYIRSPFHAINSEILDRILTGKQAAIVTALKRKLRSQGARIDTIGTEGRTTENFLSALVRSGVSVLCDVRGEDVCRHSRFSSRFLASVTPKLGIRYLAMPQLRAEEDGDAFMLANANRFDFLEECRRQLPGKQERLGGILRSLEQGCRVALMGFESDARLCCRGVVRDYLRARTNLAGCDL